MPAPVMPPPTTSRSRSRSPSARRAAARVAGDSAVSTRRARSASRAELGEHRLGFGDLVRATGLARELQRAARVLDALVAPAPVLAHACEPDARGDGGRV